MFGSFSARTAFAERDDDRPVACIRNLARSSPASSLVPPPNVSARSRPLSPAHGGRRRYVWRSRREAGWPSHCDSSRHRDARAASVQAGDDQDRRAYQPNFEHPDADRHGDYAARGGMEQGMDLCCLEHLNASQRKLCAVWRRLTSHLNEAAALEMDCPSKNWFVFNLRNCNANQPLAEHIHRVRHFQQRTRAFKKVSPWCARIVPVAGGPEGWRCLYWLRE